MGTTIFRFVRNHAFDRQADSQTAFSWLDRDACNVCSVVMSNKVRCWSKFSASGYFFADVRGYSEKLHTPRRTNGLFFSSNHSLINGSLSMVNINI